MNSLLSWGLAIVRDTQSSPAPALTAVMQGLQLPRDGVRLPRPPPADLLVRRQAPRDSGSASWYSCPPSSTSGSSWPSPSRGPTTWILRWRWLGKALWPSLEARYGRRSSGARPALFRLPWGLILAIALPLLVRLFAHVPRRPFPHRRPRGLGDRRGDTRSRPFLRGSDRAILRRSPRHPRPGLRGGRRPRDEYPLYPGHFASGALFGLAGAATYSRKERSSRSRAHSEENTALPLRNGDLGHRLCPAQAHSRGPRGRRTAARSLPPLCPRRRMGRRGSAMALPQDGLGGLDTDAYSAKEKEGSVISK